MVQFTKIWKTPNKVVFSLTMYKGNLNQRNENTNDKGIKNEQSIYSSKRNVFNIQSCC